MKNCMRLWSIHPKYLDTKGLLAVWREGLLAKNVLAGNTRGYKKHPQLIRFKNHSDPLLAINYYLAQVYNESQNRGYKFSKNKFSEALEKVEKINITSKQLEYEFAHLKRKLKKRDPIAYRQLQDISKIELNPIFKVIPGEIESWEIILKTHV